MFSRVPQQEQGRALRRPIIWSFAALVAVAWITWALAQLSGSRLQAAQDHYCVPYHPKLVHDLTPRGVGDLSHGSFGPSPSRPVTGNSNSTAQQDGLVDLLSSTSLQHIYFGIGSSARLWHERRELVRLWWQPNRTRGHVWLDETVEPSLQSADLPGVQVSENTDSLPYTGGGPRSCLRIARIVVEAFRLGLSDVRWFVMGDDDTVFNPDNVAAVLAKYDHTEMMYIGHYSETHGQNVVNGWAMGYGGAGFAISWPLARALTHTMDPCIERYPELWGSDARVQMCVAELGVHLTRERGFHQCDMKGNAAGFLQAHPLVPFLSLHHVMDLDPVFPGMNHLAALSRFTSAMRVDPSNFLQQAFCVDARRGFTVSIAWGYSVKWYEGAWRVGELEKVETTFVSYHWRNWAEQFTFDVRPEEGVKDGQCGTPTSQWVTKVAWLADNLVETVYSRDVPANQTKCEHPIAKVSTVRVIREVRAEPAMRMGLFKGSNVRRQCCQSVEFDQTGARATIVLGYCNDNFMTS